MCAPWSRCAREEVASASSACCCEQPHAEPTLIIADKFACLQVLPFIHRVLHGPGAGAAAAQALGPVLLGALWRAIQDGSSHLALPLLLDACQALQPQVLGYSWLCAVLCQLWS